MTTSGPQTATLANVTASATSVVLMAAGSRRGGTIVNASDQILYVAFAATASLTSHTVAVAVGGYYELPPATYSGVVSGIWAAAPTGVARVTQW